MKIVKCFYQDGNTVTTRINGTFEDAKEYFLNNIFNIGTIEDNLQKCVDVKEVKELC